MPINNATYGFSFNRKTRRQNTQSGYGTAPSCGGSPTAGQTLTVDPGTGWYPIGSTLEYQWFQGTSAIVNENAATHLVSAGDASLGNLQCVIAAVHASGVFRRIVQPSANAAAATGAILYGTLSDSREDWDSGVSGPDMLDGVLRQLRNGAGQTNVQPTIYLPWIRPDMEMVANGGASGTQLNIWNSGARPNGRTITALNALAHVLEFTQFPTNDIHLNVVDVATRDSIATRCINDFIALLANRVAAGKKVVWGTGIQRSDSIGGNAYGSFALLKQQCCDTINTAIIAHINATYTATQVQIADLRAITNLGGALTGAYLDTAGAPDGCHLNQRYARRVAAVYSTCVTNLGYPPRGVQPVHRATGPNLLATLSTANVGTSGNGGTILSNCTISAPDFTPYNGESCVTYTVTPTGIGFFATQLVANVGTSGGNTPPATIATGNKVKARVIATIDDFAGGVCSIDNIDLLMYATFSVAPEQIVRNGTLENVSGSLSDYPIVDANIGLVALTMPAGSSEIGAPAFGNGLRLWPFFYFQAGAPFRVRLRPAMHVVS